MKQEEPSTQKLLGRSDWNRRVCRSNVSIDRFPSSICILVASWKIPMRFPCDLALRANTVFFASNRVGDVRGIIPERQYESFRKRIVPI